MHARFVVAAWICVALHELHLLQLQGSTVGCTPDSDVHAMRGAAPVAGIVRESQALRNDRCRAVFLFLLIFNPVPAIRAVPSLHAVEVFVFFFAGMERAFS